MSRKITPLLRLCLAGSALATAGLMAPAAQARVFTQADMIAPAAASRSVHLDIVLPLRNVDALNALVARQQTVGSPDYHRWLTPAQFAAQFGPSAATKSALAAELTRQGFAVQIHSRSLRAVGPVAAVQTAFGTSLGMARDTAGGSLRPFAMSGLKMSAAMTAAGAQVFGITPHQSTIHTLATQVREVAPDNRYGRDGGYWYNDLKQAYAYPAVTATATAFDGTTKPLDGSGVVLAALMSSDVVDSDMANLFAHEKYATTTGKAAPILAGRRYIAGAQPGTLTDAYAEAAIDTQSELGGAPGASVLLYDIPSLADDNVIAGYLDVDEANEVDVVSSSFGGCELVYTPAYNNGQDFTGILKAYHELFVQGNAQGITFLASSGDEAGRECPTPNYVLGTGGKATFIPSVGFPANDPNVTAVGGTNLITVVDPTNPTAPYKYSLNSAYKGENAYADPEVASDPYGFGTPVYGGFWGAGGGPGAIWAKPDYQSGIASKVTTRMVPDIGMQVGGCPGSARQPCNGGDKSNNGNGNTDRSYGVYAYAGSFYGFIGTSLSSPEFASAVGLLVELKGRQGNLNPFLYTTAAAQHASDTQPAFHRGIPGYNGVVVNSKPDQPAHYNYTVGVGTPLVANLLGLPASTPLAGIPRTPSNP